MTADDFNAKYPIGSRFTYMGQPVTTRAKAWTINHPTPGTAYVLIEGASSGVMVDKLTPVLAIRTAEEWARRAEFARQHLEAIRKYVEAALEQLK